MNIVTLLKSSVLSVALLAVAPLGASADDYRVNLRLASLVTNGKGGYKLDKFLGETETTDIEAASDDAANKIGNDMRNARLVALALMGFSVCADGKGTPPCLGYSLNVQKAVQSCTASRATRSTDRPLLGETTAFAADFAEAIPVSPGETCSIEYVSIYDAL